MTMDDLGPSPLISVITPFLNPGAFLQEAIESVFAQTYSDWELLLIDDGTTDGSSDIARSYSERFPERIVYLEHAGRRNLGTAASRNVGISRARGKYIAFLDADDVWMPHKLACQTDLLNAHLAVAMIYGPCLHWYSWTADAANDVQDPPQDPGVFGNTIIPAPKLLELAIHNSDMLFSPSGILVRRSVAVAVGGFEERFCGRIRMYEDNSFYAKITLGESVLVMDKPCFKYRHSPNSCVSLVVRSGNFNKLRMDFLRWLSNYLARRHADEMRMVAVQELRLLRVRSLRMSLSRIARRIIPKSPRLWLRSVATSFRTRA
jgi:glycosyltransferase involved in cell wall biosynthesis